MTLAIIGAAGAIGRSTANAYHAVGRPVRLVGRSEGPLRAMAKPGDEIVIADVATAEGCRAAVSGADVVLYTLGLPYTRKDFATYAPMMRLFIEAARAAGIRRALLITNVYAYGLPQAERVAETHPRLPCSVKGRYRKEQEDVFLAAEGMETVSLRLPDFYGPDVPGSMLGMVVDAAKTGAVGNLIGPADRPHEFVFTPDVGPVVKALLEHPGKVAGVYNFAGVGIISLRNLAELIYKAAGQKPKLRVAAPWMQTIMSMFMPVLRELAEMRYLLETPVLLEDTKLRALLPGIRKTTYEDGARQVVLPQPR
jgi:nucleoside-diphosphate-sugar epimerase